jgi:DNA-binding protein H-NS
MQLEVAHIGLAQVITARILRSAAMFDKNSNYHGLFIDVGNSKKGPKSSFIEMNFASMSIDELWKLREMVEEVVAKKIAAKMIILERSLERLGPDASIVPLGSRKAPKAVDEEGRPYPPVLPRYRNPARPTETWAGRGRRPRWLTAQLKSGKQIENFRL